MPGSLKSVSAGRRATLAGDEFDGQYGCHGSIVIGIFDQFEQDSGARLAGLELLDANGSQAKRQELQKWHVVEPGDRDVPWAVQAA